MHMISEWYKISDFAIESISYFTQVVSWLLLNIVQ